MKNNKNLGLKMTTKKLTELSDMSKEDLLQLVIKLYGTIEVLEKEIRQLKKSPPSRR
jgi:hypothetical protein